MDNKKDEMTVTEQSFNLSPTGSPSPTSVTSSVVFTSPLEDTSGLDVFAQIAASAHPLPVAPTARRASIATTSSIVQQSQSQLAQSIYQNQQALRMQQQKRESIDSTVNKFDFKIEDEDEDMDDDFDEDYDLDSENDDYNKSRPKNSFSNSLQTPIKEETETDLQMDFDQSINFQRRRSPSLSVSNDLSPPQMYARRLSAPENVANLSTTSSYSTRRVIHNICERKRRENIREGFDQLQNRLPTHMANNSKLSKMEILTGAKNLINDIRGRITNLTAEIAALTQVSEQIEKKNKSSLEK